MSVVLKPHAEVKDSGVEWLGEVPTHWSVRRLRNFQAYLDGFSPNVQDILDNFEFRNQIPRPAPTPWAP